MLSIVPYDRSGQRDTDRPFKSYPHVVPTSLYGTCYSAPSFGSGLSSSRDYSSSSKRTYGDSAMDLRPPHPMMEHPPHLMDISQQHNAQHQSMLVNIKPEPSHHEKFDNGMSMGPHSSMGHHSLPYSTPQQPPHSNPPPHPAHQTPQHPQQPSDNNKSGPQISSTTGNTPPQHPGQHSPLGPDGSNGTMDNNKQQDKNSGIPPKKRPHSVPETQKDNIYWDKRRKNNESAKRSRDARRMKEEQIAMRVVYLEQENLQLRTEVSLLKSEIEKLRCMLYNS